MKITLEYEYDPRSSPSFPYWVKVGDKYFSAESFELAKERVIAYYKAKTEVVVPPPEEIEVEGEANEQTKA
jgi:hypothetical protein